jgi:hypothetical protein
VHGQTSRDGNRDEPRDIAFVDTTILPMDAPRKLENQTVVVRGDRIVEIGPSASVHVAAGALKIDGRGKFLMPGLADMHVHTWNIDDFPLFLANGVTTIRNMSGSPEHIKWKTEIAARRRVGPSIYTAGPIIDGNPPVWRGSDVVETASEAEQIVRRQKAAGYDFLKIYAHLKPEAYHAIAVAAKEHDMVFVGHVPQSVGLAGALGSGQRSIEHLDYYYEAVRSSTLPPPAGRSPIIEHFSWSDVDDAKIGRVAQQTRAAGVWNCPTLVVLQKWTSAGQVNEMLSRPEMNYVAPATLDFWRPSHNYLARMSAADIEVVRSGDAGRKRMLKALHDAGARLLLGTDTGNPFVVAGFSLHEELANFVAAGLTPYDALRAGTHDAAEFMHALDGWGTIAIGRSADLVLLDADPFADVANAEKISGVMLRGHWLQRSELNAMLSDVAAKHRAAKSAEQSKRK